MCSYLVQLVINASKREEMVEGATPLTFIQAINALFYFHLHIISLLLRPQKQNVHVLL